VNSVYKGTSLSSAGLISKLAGSMVAKAQYR